MMVGIWFALIVAIMVIGIYKIFELFVGQKERMAVIDRLGENPDVDLLKWKKKFRFFSYTSLKGGCLLIGLGLGILVGLLIQLNCIEPEQAGGYISASVYNTYKNIVVVGYIVPILVFGGAGLIAAFILERRFSRQDN